MVWTLLDYYGEPLSAGLTVSSSYGQFDLVGFPNPAAFWFWTQWLLGVSNQRSDKLFPINNVYDVKIAKSWESPDTWNKTKGNATRVIHADSNAPFVTLYVSGKPQGSLPVNPMVQGNGGPYAKWQSVPWEAGTLMVLVLSVNGTVLTMTCRQTNGPAA
jgi:hypothetical protein